MKIKIISDDGSIQGWFVAFLITSFRLFVFLLAYFFPGIKEAEKDLGGSFTSFCLLSVGSWFGYKLVKPLTQGGTQ